MAEDLALDGKLKGAALVNLLQGQREFMHDALGRAATAAAGTPATKEHVENVARIAHATAAAAAALLQRRLAAAVVHGALFIAGQDAVGPADVLELRLVI